MAREMIVVPYSNSWPLQYERERAALQRTLGVLAVDIEHFGSTSIAGMSAKPIIDVMVIVQDIGTVDAVNAAMEEQGYVPKGENGIPGRRYFVRYKEDAKTIQRTSIYTKKQIHMWPMNGCFAIFCGSIVHPSSNMKM